MLSGIGVVHCTYWRCLLDVFEQYIIRMKLYVYWTLFLRNMFGTCGSNKERHLDVHMNCYMTSNYMNCAA